MFPIFISYLSLIFYCFENVSLYLQQPMQSVPITTNVVSLNPTQAKQHYVIKFVSDLREVGGFLLVLRFPPTTKLIATI